MPVGGMAQPIQAPNQQVPSGGIVQTVPAGGMVQTVPAGGIVQPVPPGGMIQHVPTANPQPTDTNNEKPPLHY